MADALRTQELERVPNQQRHWGIEVLEGARASARAAKAAKRCREIISAIWNQLC